ncbi:hypothetical protein BGZ57DRAFT_932085 [Hyaloscypha finlandica]|nr:hypothetical protein BGZ57DRAFT_932085 [Hyaloscypha finlandica]
MATFAFKSQYTYKPTPPRPKSTATRRKPALEQVSILNKLQHIRSSSASLSTLRPAVAAANNDDNRGYGPGIRGTSTIYSGSDKANNNKTDNDRDLPIIEELLASPETQLSQEGHLHTGRGVVDEHELVNHALDALLDGEGARKQQEVEQELDEGNSEDKDERPQAVNTGALALRGSEPSSSNDDGGLSDSDPELGSDGDRDGCSSEDELSCSGTRMNVPWDPIDEQRLLAYKKERKSWKWIFRQFPGRTQAAAAATGFRVLPFTSSTGPVSISAGSKEYFTCTQARATSRPLNGVWMDALCFYSWRYNQIVWYKVQVRNVSKLSFTENEFSKFITVLNHLPYKPLEHRNLLSDMSYNVFLTAYIGAPRDHHAIFVETAADGTGYIF